MVSGGRTVLGSQQWLVGGAVTLKARRSVLVDSAGDETFEADLPAGRVAGGSSGAELLGQDEGGPPMVGESSKPIVSSPHVKTRRCGSEHSRTDPGTGGRDWPSK